MFYLGINDNRRFDIWIANHTVHVHCGTLVLELSLGQLGPVKTATNRPTDEFSSSSLGVIKDVSP